MNRTCFLKITTLASVLLVWFALSRGDTLFKGKTPLAIGHGAKLGKKLHWTDCDGKNPKDYDAPPFWTDSAANCDLSPDGFGLAIPDTGQHKSAFVFDTWTKATVQDATFLKKLFPDAKTGDTMLIYRGEGSIKFKYAGKLRELKTETPRSEINDH